MVSPLNYVSIERCALSVLTFLLLYFLFLALSISPPPFHHVHIRELDLDSLALVEMDGVSVTGREERGMLRVADIRVHRGFRGHCGPWPKP